MTLYFCKPQELVVATHSDDQIWIDPVATYGLMCYVLVDIRGPAPTLEYATDPINPDVKIPTGKIIYPTVTPEILAASIKLECRRRITMKVSDQAQRNIMSHINDIQMNRMTQAPARLPTPEEQADMDDAAAIWAWIGAALRDAASMLGTCDALIAANDEEFYEDAKWPPWNSAWDSFVARF